MALLISLHDYSITLSFVFLFNEFSPDYGLIFLPPQTIFDWMIDMVNFMLLSTRFCGLLSESVRLYSTSYVKISLSLLKMVFKLY